MQNLFHDGGFVTNGVSEEMIEGLVKLYAEDDE
jgi:enoyl-[acyl-carrier protein] reductase I